MRSRLRAFCRLLLKGWSFCCWGEEVVDLPLTCLVWSQLAVHRDALLITTQRLFKLELTLRCLFSLAQQAARLAGLAGSGKRLRLIRAHGLLDLLLIGLRHWVSRLWRSGTALGVGDEQLTQLELLLRRPLRFA